MTVLDGFLFILTALILLAGWILWRAGIHRRKAAHLGAAAESLHQLIDCLEKPSALESSDDALRALLSKQLKAPTLANQLEPEAEGGLLSELVEKKASIPAIAQAMGAIERMLVARQRFHSEVGVPWPWARRSVQAVPGGRRLLTIEPGQIVPDKNVQAPLGTSSSIEAEPNRIAPNEDAILHAVTQKVYESWAFKIVGFALIAAVMLAVAGNLVIGSTTVGLRDEMKQKADDAKVEIADRVKQTTESLEKQITAVASDQAALNQGRDAFQKSMNDGKLLIDAEIERFRAGSAQMKHDVIDEVIDKLSKDLDNKESELRVQINDTLSTSSKRITELAARLATAEELVSELEGSAKTASDSVTKAKEQLAELQSLAARSKETTDSLVQFNQLKADLQKAVEDAKIQVTNASASASTAEQQVELATRSRISVEDMAKIVRDAFGQNAKQSAAAQQAAGSAELKSAIDGVQTNLAAANKRIDDLTKALKPSPDTPAPVPDDAKFIAFNTELEELSKQLQEKFDAANKRIAAIEAVASPKPGEDSPPKPVAADVAAPGSEAALTKDDWDRIQVALFMIGYDPGRHDGQKGPKTTTAIRDFQSKTGANVNGVLTPDQIKALWAVQF